MNQSGAWRRLSSRNATSRTQRAHRLGASGATPSPMAAIGRDARQTSSDRSSLSWKEPVALRIAARPRADVRAARAPGARRVAADELLEIGQVDELVGLPSQLVGDHRRLGLQRRDDADALALLLQGRNQTAEIAVAGEKYDMIEELGETHGIDGELDIHVAFDLAPAEASVNSFVGFVTIV